MAVALAKLDDFERLHANLEKFSRVSNHKVNLGKS